jgi:ABC-type Fe3+-hydroxamate transport system substrate-binding protein
MNKLVFLVILVNSLCSMTYATANTETCERIISFSPSISKNLKFLGLEKSVVGRSSFDHEKTISSQTIVGDLFQPYIEKVKAVKPSLILILEEHREHSRIFKQLKINHLTFNHNSTDGIKKSIEALIKYCQLGKEVQDNYSKLLFQEQTLQKQYSKLGAKLRVLVAVGVDLQLNEIYLSGQDGFYSDLLNIINAENVYQSKTALVPSISKEGLKQLKPDSVVLITYNNQLSKETLKQRLSELTDMRAELIHVFNDDASNLPGPHYVQLAKRLAKALYLDKT